MNRFKMYKKADALTDKVISVAGNVISPSLILPVNAIGHLAGYFSLPTPEDIKKSNDKPLLSVIPGVSGFRLGARRRNMANEAGAGGAKIFSLNIGPISSTGLLALIGAIIDKDRPGRGATIGASTGLITHMIGRFAGLFSDHRSKNLQKAYLNDLGKTFMHYFVPGTAGFDKSKNLVTMIQNDEKISERELLELKRLAILNSIKNEKLR